MLDTTTKKRINDCRDILVGKLPDPKAQIEQITIALIYKFMDDMDKETIELGGKARFFSNYTVPDPQNPDKEITVEFAKYRWNALFDPKVTAAEMLKLYSEAIENMEKNPNIPQLFRDIFNNAYLPYRDPETLKLFLKTIGEFEYTHSEDLGDAFEYLLQVMGAQGDAGQFRTPRHIIDFLVEAVNPQKTDIILDPACGTAGFLISAFKYIRHANRSRSMTPDEQRRLIQNIKGYDISPDMVRLSLVNLYLHGFSDPHIFEYDTLSSEERWDETADVILANPPFMSPKGGIRPHKRFSIQSKRSEVLFVDYIAEHLKPGGRAGVIVPEGIIFQSGKAYKDLRKMLVENYLYAVVSLPAGVFNPYSGVKTSILLLDKELAKTTDEILFVKIENDGFSLGAQRTPVKGSQLKEAVEIIHRFKNQKFSESKTEPTSQAEQTSQAERSRSLAHAVAKTEIAKTGEYNLSGERYKKTENRHSEYPIVRLGNITNITTGKLNSNAAVKNGKYPFFTCSKEVFFIDDYAFDCEALLLAGNNAAGIFDIKHFSGKFNAYQRTYIITIKEEYKLEVLYIYLKHVLELHLEQLRQNSLGSSTRYLVLNMITSLQIPLPPLSVQEEIVKEIEGYQKIIDGAKMVVENYQPKIDIDPEWTLVELGEVCEIKRGRFSHRPRNAPQFYGGKYPFIQTGDVVKAAGGSVPYTQTLNELGLSVSKLFKPTIVLITIAANIGDTAILDYEACFTDSVVGLIPNKKLNPYFLELIMRTQKKRLNDIAPQAAQKNINVKILNEVKIPLPSIEIQNQIVIQIEKEQTLVNANKELIEIYGQKIKDCIAKVWGAPALPEKEEPAENEVTLAAEPEVKYRKNK